MYILSDLSFDIYGNDNNDMQPVKREKFLTLLIFHFDILGNEDNDQQL